LKIKNSKKTQQCIACNALLSQRCSFFYIESLVSITATADNAVHYMQPHCCAVKEILISCG